MDEELAAARSAVCKKRGDRDDQTMNIRARAADLEEERFALDEERKVRAAEMEEERHAKQMKVRCTGELKSITDDCTNVFALTSH
jgi:hypothetical protein